MNRSCVAAAISAAFLLSACGSGGGSGGGVNPIPPPPPAPPTPPPPPPPPPPPSGQNDSLANLAFSESFANHAATGQASYPKSGAAPTTSAALATGTIAYDAGTRSYTLTAAGRTLTFAAADIDASQTTATLTVYRKVNGTIVDSLTLTNPGTSGRFTYTYVGGAFWQRTVDGAATVDGSFDAFAYGVRTPGPAVPRTGTAEYAVDLIGAESLADNVVGVTGQGIMQVDFATGIVATVGTMTAPITGPTIFSSEARLASNANNFSGTFRYSDFGEFSGTISGAFYGPAAQEVGAAYAASNGDGRVAAGILIGRGETPNGSNATVTNLTANAFLAADAARLSTTLSGASGSNVSSGSFSNGAAGSSALVVSYNHEQKSYSLVAPERSQYFGPDRPNAPGGLDRSQGTVRETLSFPSPPDSVLVANGQLLRDLQYVRAARWLVAQGGANSTTYGITDFVYGIPTPDAAVPRSGTGGFVIGLRGSAADADYVNLMNLAGAGTALVDFGSGTLTGNGDIFFHEDFALAGRATRTAEGTFTLTGSIAGSANGFSGTLAFSGIGNYSGPVSGRFFGPGAEELGGSFSASDGNGGLAAGSLIGARDPELTATVPGLADLTGTTQLAALSLANPQNPNVEQAYFVYDAATRTYGYFPSMPTNAEALAYRFGPAQAVASQTDAAFSGYAGTGPAGQFNQSDTFTASLLNPAPGNPRIALTYTSYADIIVANAGGGATRQWVVFGVAPPDAQMPRSGTGQYSGIAFGHGDLSGNPIDVDGTATLSADFGAHTFQSLLTLGTRPAGTGAFTPFAVLDYRGDILNWTSLSGTINDPDAQGRLQGFFYGPNAAEFGLLFGYTKSLAQGRISIVGGAVGERD